MSAAPLAAGKLPAALLAQILKASPTTAPELLVGPKVGEDACVLELPAGALIAATDPITMTGHAIGAHSVIINANDVAVCGARPRFFLCSVLLPPGTVEADVRALFAGMGEALDAIGAVLVGGHTEITSAVAAPVVVGQMLGTCESGGWVRTGGARAGDSVVQLGPAPVEGAAVLAGSGHEGLAGITPETLNAARAAIDSPGISVVDAALRCKALGARAMHDPTEGGLSAGLHEMAEASGLAIRDLRAAQVDWFEPGVALCRAVGADPWGTLASGSLLSAFAPGDLDDALDALKAEGHSPRVLATFSSGEGVTFDDATPLPRYERDELSRVLG
jgi:hydrogenase maturation factor